MLACEIEPAGEQAVLREQRLELPIGAVDVLGVARERDPAKRALAAAKEGPYIGDHERLKVERVLDPALEGLLPQVVPIVEHRHAHRLEGEHRLYVFDYGGTRRRGDATRVGGLLRAPLLDRPPDRKVAVDEVVCGGLVCYRVRPQPPAHELREDLRRVTEHRHRNGLLLLLRRENTGEAVVEVTRLDVEVASGEAHVDAALLALDRHDRRAGHLAGEWLRTAHATQA